MTPAAAQTDYPNHPIRMILPQSPGSGSDLVARLISEKMGQALKQPVVVENRPGANGNIAAAFVAKAPADGYTILMAGVSQIAFNPSLYEKLPYDPARDFSYISPVTSNGFLLVASKQSGITSFKDLVQKAKAKPARYTYASGGAGNSTHLSTEMIAQTEGFELMHVPFNGTGPALNAVIAGQIDLMSSVVGTALPQVLGGNVVPLVVLAPERIKELPDVPTLAETGSKAAAMDGWFALVGPAGLDPQVVKVLNDATQQALADPEIKKRLDGAYLVPMSGSAERMRQRAETDAKVWGDFIRRAQIQVN